VTFSIGSTVAVLLLVLLGLMMELLASAFVLMAGLGILIMGGVVDLETAVEGFANPTLLAIASLYVVAEALRKSGALERAAELLISRYPGDPAHLALLALLTPLTPGAPRRR